MGRLAGLTHLDSTPQNTLDQTPSVSAGVTSTSSFTEESASSVPYERQLRRNGGLGHPTRPETGTLTSNRASITFPSLLVLPSAVGVLNEPLEVPLPSQHAHEPVLGTVSSHTSTPTLQGSSLVSSLFEPIQNSPARVFSTGSGHGYSPGPPSSPNPVTQVRPRPPRVKVCLLCTGGRDLPVLQDVGLIMLGLARVRNIDPENITTHTSKMIDVTFDKFFDPTDLRKGGLLILILSCHGKREIGDHVSLQFQTRDGTLVNSKILQEKIMALPKHCTLEVVVDTCYAEGVIPGLRRISTVEPLSPCDLTAAVPDRPAAQSLPSGPYVNTTPPASRVASASGTGVSHPNESPVKPAPFPLQEDLPLYKTKVVVWAASAKWGVSYPEANLPEKPGMYSIMIGAIFNHLGSNGPNVRRRDIWESVLKAVEQQNEARRERDLLKPPETWVNLVREDRIQRPVLLTSVGNTDDVLGGFVFQPIRKLPARNSSG